MTHLVPNRSQAALTSCPEANTSIRYGGGRLCAGDLTPDVIYESENYVIINKPYDVRMDGDFDFTVEKMLQKSLQKQTKWVHQLDYATSGVLCVALNRTAAAQATAAFEHRSTAKVYLAVLEGHLHPALWPTLTPQEAEERKCPPPFGNKSHEKGKVKEKRRREIEGGETWQDRALALSVDRHQQALSQLLAQAKEDDRRASSQRQQDESVSEPPVQLLEKLSTHTKEDFMKNKKLRKELRKVVSSSSSVTVQEVDQSEIQASMNVKSSISPPSLVDCANDLSEDIIHIKNGEIGTKIKPENQTKMEDVTSPWTPYGVIYRPQSQDQILSTNTSSLFFTTVLNDLQSSHAEGCILDVPHMSLPSSAPNVTLHVDIPIADGLKDEFRMSLGAGSPSCPGRPSHTQITVLEHGTYCGRPVTKVLLRPISGRRHQLRLHTKAIGHPIVGDATYGRQLKEGEEDAFRMMLHAYRLRIDLRDPKGKAPRDPCDGGRLEASSADPFPLLLRSGDTQCARATCGGDSSRGALRELFPLESNAVA